ncbi:MAG: NAD(P)H-binding protein [Myxococcaceae bacterium]
MATASVVPLRLLVLGGTGRTGCAVIDLALQRGHEVTAVARAPEKLGGPRGRLNALGGDVTREELLRELLPGHDAVISALGHRGLGAESILCDCAKALVPAMEEVGPTRLLVVSVATLFDAGWFERLLRRTLLANVCADSEQMEAVIAGSRLEWTVVRPPRLSQRRSSGGYRAEDGKMPGHARSVSREDVAWFLVDGAERPAHVRRVVGIGGARRESHRVEQRQITAHRAR